MDVYRHTDDLPASARQGVVAIGNFDGVHRGHRSVLAQAQARAAALGTHVSVLTFEPHPRSLFQPDLKPFRLSSMRTKLRILEAVGIDHVFVLHFDWDFAKISAESFVEDVLAGDLGARHVVVGEDFRFGNKRKGDAALLSALGERHGFGVSALTPVLDEDDRVISSSRVRRALQDGDVREAQRLLGRPWELEGRVEPGARRGRELGFPTANLRLGDYLEPMHGIYAMRAGIDNGPDTLWLDGAGYVGRRPAVQGEDVLLEVHLLDATADLYGKHLRVQAIEFLRADFPFDSLEAMRAQIAEDCTAARRVLADEPPAIAVERLRA